MKTCSMRFVTPASPPSPPSRPPLMTTSGCFSPYHNSQLLVFRRRGLLTQCGRLTAALLVSQVLWISIKIERGEEDGTGGGGRIEKGRDRISDIRFPNECSCGTRPDRDEIKEKGFALMTVFHASSKNHPGYSLSLSLSLGRC